MRNNQHCTQIIENYPPYELLVHMILPDLFFFTYSITNRLAKRRLLDAGPLFPPLPALNNHYRPRPREYKLVSSQAHKMTVAAAAGKPRSLFARPLPSPATSSFPPLLHICWLGSACLPARPFVPREAKLVGELCGQRSLAYLAAPER